MKKNENKKLNREDSSFDSLNSELGSFGLEPPKVYRQEQRRAEPNTKSNKGNAKKKSSKSSPKRISSREDNLTKEEKLARGKKKRKLKKKVRLAITIIGTVIAVALVVIILSLTVFFKIDTIKVTGTKTYKENQVMAVLPIQKEKNLFLIDKKSAIEKLEENLPYIYNVEITRKIPSTVIVNITEPDRVYFVKNSNNTYTYVDDRFKVLEANAKKAPKKGIELKKVAFKDVVNGKTAIITKKDLTSDIEAMMNIVKDLKIKEITGICSESKISNYIIYDKRITIKIGETKNAEDKIYSALAAIEKLNESKPDAEGTLTSTGGKQIYFTEKK